jgi:hypothetical protein
MTKDEHEASQRRSQRARRSNVLDVGTESTSSACGPCSGGRQSELAERSHARPMRSAPRCGHKETDHHKRKDEP